MQIAKDFPQEPDILLLLCLSCFFFFRLFPSQTEYDVKLDIHGSLTHFCALTTHETSDSLTGTTDPPILASAQRNSMWSLVKKKFVTIKNSETR